MNWIFASLPLLLFIVLTWIALGQLIVRRVFKIQDGFTAVVFGLSCGLIGYLFFVNALSYVIFVPISVWIVNIGVWLAVWYFRRRPLPPLEWDMDLRTRRGLAAGGVVVFVFFFVLNAREIWVDTDIHSSMIQLLASGEFPLRLQCNPDDITGYQYGGNLIAAAVVDTAAISPWDSQDVLVAYQMVCLFALILLLIRRRTKSLLAGALAIYIIMTVGHIVWLLLPLTAPGAGYLTTSAHQTYGLSFIVDELLVTPWSYGVYTPGFLTPQLAHTHRTFSWNFGPLTILLFLGLLETQFSNRWTKTIALGYLLGTVSLLQPSSLVILAPGFGVLALLSLLRSGRFSLDINPWAVIALSLLVAVVQGGVITDSIRSSMAGTTSITTSFSPSPFTFPGCAPGANNFTCTVLSLANMGLMPLLLPTFAVTTLQGRKDNSQTILVFGTLVGYLLPFLFSYEYIGWNILRTITFSSWMIAVFMTPWFYRHLLAGGTRRWLTVVFLAVATYSGVVTAWVIVDGRWIDDADSVDFSPMLPPNDLAMMPMSRLLPLDAIVFDSQLCPYNWASRMGYVLGRYTRTAKSRREWQVPPDGYEALRELPTAEGMLAKGYTHVYVDQDWYYGLTQEGKDALRLGNYQVMSVSGDPKDFRILLRACTADEQCTPNPAAFPESFSAAPPGSEPERLSTPAGP